MSANLRLVSDNPDANFPWPLTGELISLPDAHARIKELHEGKEAMKRLIEEREVKYRRLQRQVEEERDPRNQPSGAAATRVVTYWRDLCHPNSKVSKDRIKMAAARLADDYTEEQLNLAIDGIASHPFRIYDTRKPNGRAEDRHDQLKDALGDSERVERMANLGHKARKLGWSPEHGWRTQAA